MLVRRKFDIARTTRSAGRQGCPKYVFVSQQARLDPWESNFCIECIGRAFAVEIIAALEAWHYAPGVPYFSDGQELVQVAEDPDTGYIYYRRPIDIERQQQWNADQTFRVTAEIW